MALPALGVSLSLVIRTPVTARKAAVARTAAGLAALIAVLTLFQYVTGLRAEQETLVFPTVRKCTTSHSRPQFIVPAGLRGPAYHTHPVNGTADPSCPNPAAHQPFGVTAPAGPPLFNRPSQNLHVTSVYVPAARGS